MYVTTQSVSPFPKKWNKVFKSEMQFRSFSFIYIKSLIFLMAIDTEPIDLICFYKMLKFNNLIKRGN